MMKKIFAIIVMALMLVATSCGNRQAKTDVAADSTAAEVVDTIAAEVAPVDTVTVETPAEAIAE